MASPITVVPVAAQPQHIQAQPQYDLSNYLGDGVILRQADGSPFKNLPITYRTHPGAVFLLGMPREAFLVDFPARGTREVMFTVLVPAAEAAAPGAAADLSRVQVDWPED